jgi:hypothetical protein
MGMETLQKERVPWASLIIITAVASILGSIAYVLLGPQGSTLQCTFNWGISNRTTTLTILPFVLLILAYPLRKLLKLNATHLTCLYTVGMIICYSNLAGTETGYLFPVGMSRTELFTDITVRNMMGSWWWVPPYDVVNVMMSGGATVNWATWGGSLFFWTSLNLSLFLFTSGLSLVFRKRWIDVERIPFPPTMAAHEIVRAVDVKRPSGSSLRPLIVGLLLGIAFEVPIFLQALFPWFPDLYAWRSNTCPGGTWRIDLSGPMAQNIVGLAMVSKDPVSFALFFLAPLSVSFNVWFWTLIMYALEQVAYQMGYYTGILQNYGCCRVLSHSGVSLMESPPFSWGYVSGVGGATAIAVMMLYNSRGYLRQTWSQAMNPHGPLSEDEKSEAVSYRTAYIILFAGAVAVLLWHISAGIDFLSALSILIFTVFVSGIAGYYIYAHTGFLAVNNLRGGHSWFPIEVRWGGPLPGLSPDMIMTNWTTQAFTNGTILMNFPIAQMMPFKMASLTGTSNRSTYLVAVMAVLVATPLILMTKVWIVSTYGVSVFTQSACAIDAACSGRDWAPPLSALASYGAVGFVITLALSFLHARFVWFPLEPLGFVIATGIPGNWYGVWSSFFVAWVAKTMVLRIGGSKIYERYGVPAVGGFVGGVILTLFVGSIMLVIRFFFPF